MTEMLSANFRGYDPTLAEDVWTIRGLFQVDGSGKIEVRDQGIIDVDVDWETAGETGRPLSSIMRNTVVLGGYANAIKGYMDCDGGGGSLGLLSGINGEIRLPDASGHGAYFSLEGEIVFQTNSAISHIGHGISAGWLYLGASGDGLAEFNTYGVFMSLTGLTPGAGELLSLDYHTLKCDVVVAAAHYAKYLVFSIAENMISHSFSALAADGRMFKLTSQWDTPGTPDGEGIFNISANITGTTTGEANLCSAWLNIVSAADIQGWSHLHTDGFYEAAGATVSSGHFAWAKYAVQFVGNPLSHYIMDLNFAGANSTIDAIYNVNNPALALGYTAGADNVNSVGSIPFFATGGTPKYIRLYAAAA